MPSAGGVVAAGHPLTAEAGARVLRAGGNAVDAAVGALLASTVCEPLLTGLGAGGYLLCDGFDDAPTLLDFFVAAPGRDAPAPPADPVEIDVDFGDAHQVFNVGAPTVGTWGVPAGVERAIARWGSVGLSELTTHAAGLARDGVEVNEQQAYLVELLEGIWRLSDGATGLFAPGGAALRLGHRFAWPDLGDALDRLGADGAAPFYSGDVARAVLDGLEGSGSVLTAADLAGYEALERAPVHAVYRGRDVFTNPPPNAGGVLIAAALKLLDEGGVEPVRLVEVMQAAQRARTRDFIDGLVEDGFAARFLASRLGSTTHVSVVDAEGRACAVTTTNGEGCGIVVPGTGMHPNNIMGELDLNPFGLHAFDPGRRMPSMMAPTIVRGEGGVELVVGSAGSNRIRSAIVQVIVGVLDRGLPVGEAVGAPRLHFEEGEVYAEPGIDVDALSAAGHEVRAFREQNLFFGGAQAVTRDPATGALRGAGDPRRGGAVAYAEAD